MDTIEIILILIFGLIVGWRASAHVHLAGFRELLRQLKISDQDLIAAVRRSAPQEWHDRLDILAAEQASESAAVVNVRLEQQGNQIYAYRKSDDLFLGQGTDPDSLIARLNETMTSSRVVVSQEDGADLLQKSHT